MTDDIVFEDISPDIRKRYSEKVSNIIIYEAFMNFHKRESLSVHHSFGYFFKRGHALDFFTDSKDELPNSDMSYEIQPLDALLIGEGVYLCKVFPGEMGSISPSDLEKECLNSTKGVGRRIVAVKVKKGKVFPVDSKPLRMKMKIAGE
jgi:hypothetical protein